MITFRRPILAASLLPPDVEHTDKNILAAMRKLRYPVMASLKKDGIRALRLNGTLLSRTLKSIPNTSICRRSLRMPGGFDVELYHPELSYNEIESIVMSALHPDSDKIQFHVLDWFGAADSYVERLYKIRLWDNVYYSDIITPFTVEINNADELMAHFLTSEKYGEGICFRTSTSPYKQGRSTLKEQYLVKLTRYVIDEATIIGFTEQYENANPDHYNRVGMMDRSDSMDGLVPKGTLGAFVVKTPNGIVFNIGTGVGLTNKLRKKIWDERDSYIGRTITYKCKPYGCKDAPRSPVWKGFRDGGI